MIISITAVPTASPAANAVRGMALLQKCACLKIQRLMVIFILQYFLSYKEGLCRLWRNFVCVVFTCLYFWDEAFNSSFAHLCGAENDVERLS